MSYTKNPYLPRVRRDAADLVRRGWGVRRVARYIGVSPGTVTKWVAKAKRYGYHPIPTLSSRPKSHPKELSEEMKWKIFEKRKATGRCAEVIQQELVNEGISVSLSSVKRTLDRMNLTKKRSPWKKYRVRIDRPNAEKPGDLVEVDTIHLLNQEGGRVYVFTLLDVCSRFAYARAYQHATATTALRFIREAQNVSPFEFKMLQSDNGSEFSRKFSEKVASVHRHTRVRRPNDNAHLERFNRTLQDECLSGVRVRKKDLNAAMQTYLPYYNERRLHMGIDLKTPLEILSAECFQAID